jgi:hypothetical protein
LQKTAEGWTLAGIEWKRETSGAAVYEKELPLPFGTQVGEDRVHLIGNPTEQEILKVMMKLIVDEVPFSGIADELNRIGHRTREGKRWTQTSVY